MVDPRVTVVVPTYNRSNLLAETIRSILAQTHRDFAVFISDNASTDDTSAVVAGFKDERVQYHRQLRNIGMTANFRSVIEMVRTEFVAVIPDDDLMLPDHLGNAIAALDAFPMAAFYACPAEMFGDGMTRVMRPRAIADTTRPLIYVAPRQAAGFLGIDTPSPFHAVLRRSAIDADLFWGQPSFYPFDALVLIQMMTRGGFVFGNQATTRFRVHPASTSSGANNRIRTLRYNCMIWFCVRWLSQFLLDRSVCSSVDLERHGMEATSAQHVVPFVLGLGSFDSAPPLRSIAYRVFRARRDMDTASARFRLARRAGFWSIPVAEKLSQQLCGWHP